jgi:hypothetical protein
MAARTAARARTTARRCGEAPCGASRLRLPPVSRRTVHGPGHEKPGPRDSPKPCVPRALECVPRVCPTRPRPCSPVSAAPLSPRLVLFAAPRRRPNPRCHDPTPPRRRSQRRRPPPRRLRRAAARRRRCGGAGRAPGGRGGVRAAGGGGAAEQQAGARPGGHGPGVAGAGPAVGARAALGAAAACCPSSMQQPAG